MFVGSSRLIQVSLYSKKHGKVYQFTVYPFALGNVFIFSIICWLLVPQILSLCKFSVFGSKTKHLCSILLSGGNESDNA